jgi:hypothetical protein
MANIGYANTRMKMPTFGGRLSVRGLVSICVPA